MLSEYSLCYINISSILVNDSLIELTSSHNKRNESNSQSFAVNSNGRATTLSAEDDIIDRNVSQQSSTEIIGNEPLVWQSNSSRRQKMSNYSKYYSSLYPIFNYGNDFDLYNRLFNEKFNSSNSKQTVSTNNSLLNSKKLEVKPNYGFKANTSEGEDRENNGNPIIGQEMAENMSSSDPNKVTLIKPYLINSNYSSDATILKIEPHVTEINRIIETDYITGTLLNITEPNANHSAIVSKTYDVRNHSERYCISSNDCDIYLNERCVKRKKHSVCDCKEPFFRESSSQRCQIKKLIRLLFRISSNQMKRLNNSIESIQLKHSIEAIIWSAIANSSHLISIVDDIKVIELKNVEIVVDFYVKIADKSNDFHHKYIEYNFWYRLMSSIRGIDYQSLSSLKSFNMRAIEVVDNVNYCLVKELNYCSDFADCLEDLNSERKFFCKCKPGLTDMSVNINYSGEVCALQCSIDLCGSGGVCDVRNQTEIHCICKNWNFGDRCQYSLNALLAVISVIGLLSIFVSFCLTALYCGCKIHEEFVELKKIIKVLPVHH